MFPGSRLATRIADFATCWSSTGHAQASSHTRPPLHSTPRVSRTAIVIAYEAKLIDQQA